MTETICIEIDHAEGSLQRLIGLIEHRGFRIETLLLSAGREQRRNLTIGVRPHDPSRCFQVLCRHIDRVYGARRIHDK